MNLENYTFSFGEHRNKKVIWIGFEYSIDLKNALRKRFPSAKWSNTNKKWYLPDLNAVRKELSLPEKEMSSTIINKIHPINQAALTHFIEQLKLKAYSRHTIRLYIHEFSNLLISLKNVHVDTFNSRQVEKLFSVLFEKRQAQRGIYEL